MKKSPRICFLLVFPAVLQDTGHTVQTCDSEGLLHKKKQSMLLIFFSFFLFYNILAGKMSVLINPQVDTDLQAGRGVHKLGFHCSQSCWHHCFHASSSGARQYFYGSPLTPP